MVTESAVIIVMLRIQLVADQFVDTQLSSTIILMVGYHCRSIIVIVSNY